MEEGTGCLAGVNVGSLFEGSEGCLGWEGSGKDVGKGFDESLCEGGSEGSDIGGLFKGEVGSGW